MKTGALLVLVATVLGVDGGSIEIDKGSADGLQQGDAVAVYYTLTVRSEEKRVDVGSLRVADLEEESATLTGEAAGRVRPGFLAEVRIPAERLSPESLLKMVGQPTPAPPPATEAPGAAAESIETPAAEPVDPFAGMVQIPAGRHEIGSDLSKNVLYSQHPRFEMSMATFWIDAEAVSARSALAVDPSLRFGDGGGDGRPAVGLDFFAAQAHCRARGKRLPTEFEWEAASAGGWVDGRSSVYEWTDSWYRAYPGNKIQEPEYGEKFRVLRGGVDGSNEDPRARRFMAPGSHSSSVGFRCAADDPSGLG